MYVYYCTTTAVPPSREPVASKHAQDAADSRGHVSYYRILPFPVAIFLVHVRSVEDLGLDEVRVAHSGSMENRPGLVLAPSSVTSTAAAVVPHRLLLCDGHLLPTVVYIFKEQRQCQCQCQRMQLQYVYLLCSSAYVVSSLRAPIQTYLRGGGWRGSPTDSARNICQETR